MADTDRRHEFQISVRTRGRGADWWSELVPVTVKAYNLAEALAAAGKLPLSAWFSPEEVSSLEGDPLDLKGHWTFANLPAGDYPLQILFFRITDQDGLNPVQTINIPGPQVTKIPALAPVFGPVWVRLIDNRGKITEHRPKASGEA